MFFPNHQNYFGFIFLHQMTPLHVAAKKGLVKALESLVKKGAEIDIKDNKGVRNYIY